MKSFDAELKKYAEKVTLKARERDELRERLLSYMEYHPLPKIESVRAPRIVGIPSESFVMLRFRALHARIIGGVVLLFVVLAPFVAERSVPGDVLYLVKTGFNESIQEQLAFSPYEKIEFETKLMERRIAEARSLASEGKLTDDAKAHLAETVKEHTDAVQSHIAELRTQDVDGAAIAEIAFNSSLEVQSAVIAEESANGGDATSMQSILSAVNEARGEVADAEDSVAPSFDGLLAQFETETTRAYELFETVKKTATDDEIRDIERRLRDIERLANDAKKVHGRGGDRAVNDVAKTLGLVQKLIVFMTDIDVREAVALEMLVPVVLSDEERMDAAEEEIRVVGGVRADVAKRIEVVGEEGTGAKVVEGVAKLDELLLRARTALDVADIANAEHLLTEAHALAADLDNMTQDIEIIPESTEGENSEDIDEDANEEQGDQGNGRGDRSGHSETSTSTTTEHVPVE